jgi:transcriptional regulator with XRE-family HTH domain
MSKARSRFATALQQARLGAHLTQEQLVEQLHVNQRTAISWETGERIPSIGMVFLLSMILSRAPAASTELFSLELLIPYLLDDLERQKKFHQEGAFQELVEQGIQKLLRVDASLPRPAQALQVVSLLPEQPVKITDHDDERASRASSQSQRGQREAENTDVEQIFTLLERLRARPELIPVVNDFLDQLLSE